MLTRFHLSLAILALLGCPPPSPAWADCSIVARTDMPNHLFPQAEVRLLTRGDERVVQSAILPRFPGKVLNKITRSEQNNWQGNPDAIEYVEVLQKAFQVYRKEYDRKTTALVIDFVSAPDASRIDFSFAGAIRTEMGIVLQPAPVWRSLALSEQYIGKNQEYILIDAFGKDAEVLIQTLRTTTHADDGE